jgi:predicted MPP superfamily phosphohydrolase
MGNPSRGRHNSRLRRMTMAAVDASLLRGRVAKWSYRCGLHGKLCISTYDIQAGADHRLDSPLLIAFASDFHAGASTHPELFATLADELIAQRPDVLLLGGDFVSCKAEDVDALSSSLARVSPPAGKYGVLGNHDLWTDEQYIIQRLEAAGVSVLVNRNVRLPAPFSRVSLCGIDDPWTGNADATTAFANAGPIRIFLTHSPDGLLLLGTQRFDVGFAGHTHGGQVALRNGTPILSAGGPLSRTYARGRFDIPATAR